MQLKVGAVTNIGKVRSSNEDNFCLNGWHLPQKHFTSNHVIQAHYDTTSFTHFGVFDGMGGYMAGDRASYLAATTEEVIPKLQYPPKTVDLLPLICKEANLRICSEMELIQGQTGSTASMLGFLEDELYICNIGDSPVFRFRDHVLQQISAEHTERSGFEKATGKKTDYRQKFHLTQNLGISPSEFQIEPFFMTMPVLPADRYLICSDGLTDMVSPDRIQQILDSEQNLEQCCNFLIQEALEAGGKDNITIVLIDTETVSSDGGTAEAAGSTLERMTRAVGICQNLAEKFHFNHSGR